MSRLTLAVTWAYPVTPFSHCHVNCWLLQGEGNEHCGIWDTTGCTKTYFHDNWLSVVQLHYIIIQLTSANWGPGMRHCANLFIGAAEVCVHLTSEGPRTNSRTRPPFFDSSLGFTMGNNLGLGKFTTQFSPPLTPPSFFHLRDFNPLYVFLLRHLNSQIKKPPQVQDPVLYLAVSRLDNFLLVNRFY